MTVLEGLMGGFGHRRVLDHALGGDELRLRCEGRCKLTVMDSVNAIAGCTMMGVVLTLF